MEAMNNLEEFDRIFQEAEMRGTNGGVALTARDEEPRPFQVVVDVGVPIAAKTEGHRIQEWASGCLLGVCHNGGEMVQPESYVTEAAAWAKREPQMKGNRRYMDEVREMHRELGAFPVFVRADGRLMDIERYQELVAMAFSARDATYVDLAERLRLPLLTVDVRLARALRAQPVECRTYTPEDGPWERFCREMQEEYRFLFVREWE